MEIIIKPVLTEKMTALTDKQRKVAFIVAKEANKIEIKKAIVTLAEGDSIDFFSNI